MSETHLGAAMAGGNPSQGRSDHDLYETPPLATLALVNWLGPALPAKVWEIACGNHHITKFLRAHGCEVFENDLIDRGDHVVSDYLASAAADAPFSPLAIITNPPWDQASAFIEHSLLVHQPRFMALLLKAQFFHNRAGVKLSGNPLTRPTHTLPVSFRLDFRGRRNPAMDCTWFVWAPDLVDSHPRFEALARPV